MLYYYGYCNLKFTGTTYRVRTAFPFCLPGAHRGIELITRKASASKDGSKPRKTVVLLNEPSLLTINITVTLPLIPSSIASLGYCTLSLIKSNIAFMPPGNAGISSTT